MKKALLFFLVVLTGCAGIPAHVTPVDHFRIDRYLGKWYEIARLDHSFERGMTHVTADYSLGKDGEVTVLNQGYAVEQGSWKKIRGKAYFVKDPDQGYLKVSFFGPFYASYIIFELDQDTYQYALVSGPDKSYLWLLSRRPEMDEDIKNSLLKKAAASGFDVSRLIFVDQNRNIKSGSLGQ